MSEGAPSKLKLYSLLVLMVTIWASNFAVAKVVVKQIPPLLTVSLRMLLAGAAMLPIYRAWTRRTGRTGWSREDFPLLMFLGLVGVGLNQALFVIGISITSVSHAAILIGLTPMLVLTMASISGLERMSRARLAGMGMALCGVGILQTGSSPARTASTQGDLLIFLAASAFALFTVRSKAEIHRFGGVTVNTFAYVGSGVALLPITIWYANTFDFRGVTWNVWAGLVYMALFPAVICYLIYYYALTWIPASRVSAFAYLQPLIAVLIAIPVLGEYPTTSLLGGGALVLAGVFVAERV